MSLGWLLLPKDSFFCPLPPPQAAGRCCVRRRQPLVRAERAPARGRAAETPSPAWTRLVQQAGARLQTCLLQAPAAFLLCSSFPAFVAASRPASGLVRACASYLASGNVSWARSGPFCPFLSGTGQLCTKRSGRCFPPWLHRRAGRVAAPWQGAVASSQGWDLLQKHS